MRKMGSIVVGKNLSSTGAKLVLFLFASILTTGASAQLTGISGQTYMTFSARGGLRLPNMENVDGSPYLDNQFHSARVKTKSGFDTTGIPVKFNAYGNEIIFIENGVELAIDSVDMISYTTFENGEVTEVIFQCGFPNIDGFTSNTLYRVLAAGPKVQLLKHYSKRLEDVKSMGEYNKKEFIAKEQLFIYSPAAGMKKIKADKKALQEAFPELAAKMELVVTEKKLKLKKESDLALLIEELNKP
jgi:hypothetical protein